MFAAAAAVSTVVIFKTPLVDAAIVAVSPDVGVITIESSVITVEPIVKSVVASIVVPLIVVAELAPTVAPSTVPPSISTVVIVPKSATVFPAFVQLLLIVKLEPSSAAI